MMKNMIKINKCQHIILDQEMKMFVISTILTHQAFLSARSYIGVEILLLQNTVNTVTKVVRSPQTCTQTSYFLE